MAEKTAGATATPGAELAELHGGRFGRCEAREAERLDALPYTTLCLADARRRAQPR